jgi:5-methylcytosine-specific restriction protein A
VPVAAPRHLPDGHLSATDRRAAREAARPSPSLTYGRRWQKLRAAYLATHPLCECGCGHAASVVDHRQPHNGNDRLMYSWDNLQAMTKQCHDRKTASHDGGFGNPLR